MIPTHNILIGTPAYGGLVFLEYLASITGYFRAGLEFSVAAIGNEALITRARNAMVSRFYEELQYTHLLFLDSDVFLATEGLARLLAHGVDVIGAAVSLKQVNERGEPVFNIGDCLGEWGALHEVDRIGAAALLLSRKAVTDLVAEARAGGRVYAPGLSWSEPIARMHYEVFQAGVVGDDYLSEDAWICRRLRQLGYRIFLDPGVATRRQGDATFQLDQD